MLVISGYAELVQETLKEADPIYEFVGEIIDACKKSTDIVNQLLAFARKQTISPKIYDLNEIVEGMLKMLRRLIGEDIDLLWLPEIRLWPIKIDPAQIDQILANLFVNARDAISGVGKITIETGKTVFDEEYCSQHAGFIPGKFVMLAVSDNGCGMNKETLDKIFEPFFTTKPIGKGTGLGLPMIYGIVKQNNGFINVYSELGKGTTIKIYLPKHSGRIKGIIDNNAQQVPAGFGETVLVVEDEKTIMKMSKLLLEKLGYQVLTADTPGKALHLAKEHSGKIHLLITDVVMPEMNGRDLADQIEDLYPNIKTLFMSGYTANVIAHHGVLDEGVAFIQKPFSKKDLAEKVREVLKTASD
jgi:two-component system, cell cycle sensor histidine kinase and response regulator CckA